MPEDFDIVILGAGFGGLGMGATLKRAGIENFAILEQEQALGGTWRDNIYPGAACDTESHLYCFDFSYHIGVSRLYARQPELLSYAERIAGQNDLGQHIRYGKRIVAAEWDGAAQRWRIALADGDTLTARVFIPAWGQLNRPAIPAIPGQDDFGGLAFHSARWPRDLDLAGKRVASIGNAASAIQYIPEIAPEVAHLTVFQRSPNWIVPRNDRPYTPEEREHFSTAENFRADRQALFDWRETTFERMMEGSDEATELEATARQHALTQVPDPALRAKLIPDFPLGCKRVLRSDDYFPALMRDNVTLETDRIERMTPKGIVTADGVLHAVDVIIYGTGFETQSFQGPVEVHGRGGTSLRAMWKDGAFAYLGITVPLFPNLFLIYGPNTNLGHNSILSMFEAQFGYIVQAIRHLLTDDSGVIEVREEVARNYDDKLQAAMNGTAWTGSCTSWYKNANGRVVNNWSSNVQSYKDITAIFNAADYAAAAESVR
jgi:cation diffusion facilitator CzcD-associated flavoprotein CzcO